jgi:protein-disulfide isomerase
MEPTMTRNPMLIRLGVLAAVAIVAVLVAVTLASPNKSEPAKGHGEGAAATAAFQGIPQSGIALGSPKAPVTMVEFADLQCPFCAEYQRAVFPTILKRYVRAGKVRVELRLLRFLGPDSDRLARAAAAVAAQNRMWQFVELAYQRQGAENSGYATDDFINSLAAGAGLKSVNAGASAEAAIARNEQAAQTLGVDSTPSFLIGRTGSTLHRFEPSELTPGAFTPQLDKELQG